MILSYEVEQLIKYIDNDKKYLTKATNPKQVQILKARIMYFQDYVLPILLRSTEPVYSEIAKYAILCYKKAVEKNCNALLVYIPITDEYNGAPRIGIANCRHTAPFGTPCAVIIECKQVEITNMDGRGTENVGAINISIHELL